LVGKKEFKLTKVHFFFAEDKNVMFSLIISKFDDMLDESWSKGMINQKRGM